MTERTYGIHEWSLDDLLKQNKDFELYQMAARIRELETENAKLKADNSHAGLRAMVQRLTEENTKLKAERRELAMRVAMRVNGYAESPLPDQPIAAIVKQELAK